MAEAENSNGIHAPSIALFHSNHGSLVQLSENHLTAFRQRPSHEFNQGLVFSSKPLKDDELFEVRIDRKVHSWTGSLQIGVVTHDPAEFDPTPPNALDIVNRAWVLSGCNLFENGKIIVEDYGPDLDELSDGDRVGVMRTREGDLVFYVNSFAQGVAATGIPPSVYAVVDLYGKCVQATVMNHNPISSLPHPTLSLSSNLVDSNQQWEESTFGPAVGYDRLRFHHRCGSMVKLSASQRTSERRRPLDEFNNGVVMTQRPLLPDELFEIRIESLVDKWSGSIEVGITTHNPATLDFPSTMTNLRSGTIMMSGCGILTNGKGTRREYGNCNLDELAEGDRIGLVRKSNGDLHFYVNGRDQGVAASNVPQPVWGVVDLYGRTVKVSLIDREDAEKCGEGLVASTEDLAADQLLFHPRCGLHAAVVNGGTTAHRPNAESDFNHGVVLTARPLKADEIFEVVLDQVVLKWAGSIEIGVTTHRPEDLDFPATMTNIRSGTWMMTGNGVMHNGVTILDGYGRSLDRLSSGDRVGVVRRSNGVLHFYVNGEDQGPAAGHIPPNVYGVVDLYGQAAQVSIVDHAPSTPPTDSSPYTSYLYPGPQTTAPLVSPTSLADSTYAMPSSSSSCTLHRGVASPLITYTDLCFHPLHGRNTILTNNGLTASRPNALSEFNDAIVMTSRPLRPGEMFEVLIEKLVERWSGSLELGVTAIHPENLDFPSTMTDIDYETWMLSGSSVMQDGTIVRNGYPLDLDSLTEGNRVGLLRHADGTLHYYLDGQDQGMACSNIPSEVYAVIDLYGQCAQVSLVHRPLQAQGIPEGSQSPGVVASFSTGSLASGLHPQNLHHLSSVCGRSVCLLHGCRTARRDEKDFENGLIFSSSPLSSDEVFEVRIDDVLNHWSGSLALGLTTTVPSEGLDVPASISQLEGTWYFSGSNIFHNRRILRSNVAPNLERLGVGDVVSIRRAADSSMRIAINGNDLNFVVKGLAQNVYAVVDLYGMVQSVTVKSIGRPMAPSAPESLMSPAGAAALSGPPSSLPVAGSLSTSAIPLSLSQLALREAMQGISAALSSRFGTAFSSRFHDNHGRNVALKNHGQAAVRTASYNQGVLFSKEPLAPSTSFQVKIDQVDSRWTGSLMIGVTGQRPEKVSSPMNALAMKRSTWIVSGNSVHHCGLKIRDDLHFNLNQLQSGQCVGVFVSESGQLHIVIDGQDQGSVASIGTNGCLYAVVDLYGRSVEVSIVSSPRPASQGGGLEEKAHRESSTTEKDRQPAADSNRSCHYREICGRFVSLMGLPEACLDLERSHCCCELCFSSGSNGTKMDPWLKGWCRFAVQSKRSNVNSEGGSNEKWQSAFHGTRAAVVRRILDEGRLLPPDLSIWQRSRAARISKDHDGDSEGCQLLFSPLLNLASSPSSAPPVDFYDPLSKKKRRGQIVLQILVQPGSYKVRRASSPLGSTAGAPGSSAALLNVADEAVFWYTKERGAAIVEALLVRMEEI